MILRSCIAYGGDGNDTLLGGWSDDELRGGEGDDFLGGRSGDDDLYGESGSDNGAALFALAKRALLPFRHRISFLLVVLKKTC